MANFLKKLIGNISSNKKVKDDIGTTKEIGYEGENTGDETREKTGIAGAGAESLGNPAAFSRENAKAELERHIAEKLARMSETDFDELFKLHEKQLRDKKALDRNAIGRNLPEMEGQISFMEIKSSGVRGFEGGDDAGWPEKPSVPVGAFGPVEKVATAGPPEPGEVVVTAAQNARLVPTVTVTRGEKVAKFVPGEADEMVARFVPDESDEKTAAFASVEPTENVEPTDISEQVESNLFSAPVETDKHSETDEKIAINVPAGLYFEEIESENADEADETFDSGEASVGETEDPVGLFAHTEIIEAINPAEELKADELTASVVPGAEIFEGAATIADGGNASVVPGSPTVSPDVAELAELFAHIEAVGTEERVETDAAADVESEDVELAGMSEQIVSNQFGAMVETGEADEPVEPESGIPLSEKIEAGIIASVRAAEAFSQSLKKSFRQAASACRRGASVCVAAAAAVFKRAASKLPSYSDMFPQKPKSEQVKSRKAKYVLLNYKRRFIKKEKQIASRMAHFITHLDRRNDKLAETTVKAVKKSHRRFHVAREWADLNKKKLLAGLFALVVVSVTAVSIVNYCTAYVYAYNGRTLGMVKNQDDVLHILEVVSEQLTREYGTNINIDESKDITFERVFAVDKEIDDMQEVLNRLTYMQDMNATAYALYIDDKRVAVLDTQERADVLLNDFKNIYLPASTGVTYESVTFAENVDIKPIDTQLGKIQNPDDIIFKLQTGAVAQKIHVVQKGETFSGIAKMYGLKQSELEASNPGITPAKLSIAQEIILTQAVPLLTVQTVEVTTYPDVIPYETVYEDNPQVFKGEETVKVSGVNGEREVTARIIRNNGIEVGREELNATIIKEASSAIVSRGTKALPPLQGTGKLIYPVSGYRLTSKFGTRWGRMHNGIDMACRTGTRIGAADGGTVTFSGYKGSLGYVVIIDHGGNRETLYGHCSKLFVSRGDKVYQGQHIANVGNTGRSTGPHLHFEVHVGGVIKNPQNYL